MKKSHKKKPSQQKLGKKSPKAGSQVSARGVNTKKPRSFVGAPLSNIRQVPPDQLKPHPVNIEIYGDVPAVDLVASIAQHGVLQPLLVTTDNLIIAGHRRHAASLEANVETVPVMTVHPVDANAEVDMLLAANRQRQKTNEQMAREVTWQMKIEQARARGRQVMGGKHNEVPAISPEAAGDARDYVARKMAMGAKKVDQCVAVIEKLDELKAAGNDDEVLNLKRMLEKSVNKAAKRVAVLTEREKHPVAAAQETEEPATAKESKADIITRMQENLVDGIERWSIEKLLLFETALAEFRENWEEQEIKEVA